MKQRYARDIEAARGSADEVGGDDGYRGKASG